MHIRHQFWRRGRDKPILNRQSIPKAFPVCGETRVHLLAETNVLPLAQWSSVSNKCNSTSFPTSVHIFRPWDGGEGGLYGCVHASGKKKTLRRIPDLSLAVCVPVFASAPECVSVCVCGQPGSVLFLSLCLGCNLNKWRLWAGGWI